jgi:hypothetical protein
MADTCSHGFIDPLALDALLSEMRDITGAECVEVRISRSPTGTGAVLWVNTEKGCVLRICRVKELNIEDERKTR